MAFNTRNKKKTSSSRQSNRDLPAQSFEVSRPFDETTFAYRLESEKFDEVQFKPRQISTALDAVTRTNMYQYGTHTKTGYLEWLPAEGISATVLTHHVNHFALRRISKTAAKVSCERVCCDTNTEHFDAVDASVAFYVYGSERGFIIDSSWGFCSSQLILCLKVQSARYALMHGVLLENLSLAEFYTATWIHGGALNVYPRALGDQSEQYAGGLICYKCMFWSPYGLMCTNEDCKAWLSTIDESFCTEGHIGKKAIKYMAENAESYGLHLKEDVSFGVGGMAIMAIIGMFLLGGAVGGA